MAKKNIWEFLGLPKDHRKSDSIVQYVRHHDEVIKKVTLPISGQLKEDGVYSMVVYFQGKIGVFGRTGLQLTSLEHVYPKFGAEQPDMVLINELCCDTCSLEQLSGIVNPNRNSSLDEDQAEWIKSARFAYHDILTIQELIDGVSTVECRTREYFLTLYLSKMESHFGKQLPSVVLFTDEQVRAFADGLIKLKKEGAVFKDSEAGWEAGRKNEVATKLVKGVDYDLLVVGVEEGKGKRSNMVANLICLWRPYGLLENEIVTHPFDGCFDDSMRIAWWKDPSLVIGQVWHIHGLCVGSKGSVRLGKAKEHRIDKFHSDLGITLAEWDNTSFPELSEAA